jgi:hypothetical protein
MATSGPGEGAEEQTVVYVIREICNQVDGGRLPSHMKGFLQMQGKFTKKQ